MPDKLSIAYDEQSDIVTIEGIRYSGDLFREFSAGGLAVGVPFEIVKRGDDSALTIRRIEAANA